MIATIIVPIINAAMFGKIFFEHEVLNCVDFEDNGTNTAIYKAKDYLLTRHYTIGVSSPNNPTAFIDADDFDYVPAWHHLTHKERNKIDGIIIPLENNSVRILFFTDK